MANKHLKAKNMGMAGTAVTNSTKLYEVFNKGMFHYQFQRADGSYSRIMRCSTLDELLWLTEQLPESKSIIVGEPIYS